VGFEERPFDFDGQVADAKIKQLFVAQTMPGESVAHGALILAVARGRVKNTLDKIHKIFRILHRQFSGVLNLENLLSGSLRISAPTAFELPFNAENAEIRRGRRENRSIEDTTGQF
jgi:hypothetical protein